jgi:hypothetical protein
MMARMLAMMLAGLIPAAALAQPQQAAPRDLCADRPGLGTPPCTVEPGRMMVELGLGDWTRESDAQERSDSVEIGELALRVGLTDSLEAQFGWTAYGHVRTRDRVSGAIDRSDGVGDVRLALLQNFRNPDGSGFSIAAMPYMTLPAGGKAIGAGDWGAGLLIPVSFDLGGGLSLGLTPEVDAAVDEDGDGRHLAYGSVVGLGVSLGDTVSATVETSLMRDDDPAGRNTQALGGLSFAWQPSDAMQLDIGLNVGLNADSPDSEVYFGVTRRF